MGSLQWISEVLHFCSGLPIILVGCKKDLRYDQKTIEELHKTSQKPVTPEQVCSAQVDFGLGRLRRRLSRALTTDLSFRARKSARRLAHTNILNAQRRRVRVSVKCSNTPHARRSSPRRARAARRAVDSSVPSCDRSALVLPFSYVSIDG